MKKKNDLEEQKAFENEIFSSEDERLYTLLFEELSKEDAPLTINPNFAPSIATKLAKKKKRDQIKENTLFTGAIVMILLVTFGGLEFAKSLIETERTIMNIKFAFPIITFIGLIIIFQVVDKTYIRNRKFRHLNLK